MRAAKSFVVKDRDGLHARPCARIARAAQKFRSDVTLTRDGRRADARSVLELLRLEAACGAVIEVEARGDDAAECVEAVGREVSV